MAEPFIRAAAIAAFRTAEQGRTAQAREAIAGVLDGLDVDALQLEHIEVTDRWSLFVFGDQDVHLAARVRGQQWEVRLVAPIDNGWSEGVLLESLEHLGRLLPPTPPGEGEPTSAAWVQPTGAHDAYATGDNVTHKGRTWVSLIDGNVWEPGVSGWREVTA